MSEPQLEALLRDARERNESRGITGRLLYASSLGEPGTFVQWIEGEPWRIRDLFYASILLDPRHAVVGKPFEGPIRARVFPEWSMKYTHTTSDRAVTGEIDRLTTLAETLLAPARSVTAPRPRSRQSA